MTQQTELPQQQQTEQPSARGQVAADAKASRSTHDATYNSSARRASDGNNNNNNAAATAQPQEGTPEYQRDTHYYHKTQRSSDATHEKEHRKETEATPEGRVEVEERHILDEERQRQAFHDKKTTHRTEQREDGTHEFEETREITRAPGEIRKVEHRRDVRKGNDGAHDHTVDFQRETKNSDNTEREHVATQERDRSGDRNVVVDTTHDRRQEHDRHALHDQTTKRQEEEGKEGRKHIVEEERVIDRDPEHLRQAEHKVDVERDSEGKHIKSKKHVHKTEQDPSATREQEESAQFDRSEERVHQHQHKRRAEHHHDPDVTRETDIVHDLDKEPGRLAEHKEKHEKVHEPHHEREVEKTKDIERTPTHTYTKVTAVMHDKRENVGDDQRSESDDDKTAGGAAAVGNDSDLKNKKNRTSEEKKQRVHRERRDSAQGGATAPQDAKRNEAPEHVEQKDEGVQAERSQQRPQQQPPVQAKSAAVQKPAESPAPSAVNRASTATAPRAASNAASRPQESSNQHHDAAFGVRHIPYHGDTVSIVMQNENGPCPIIALCNALALKRRIRIPYRETRNGHYVTLSDLLNLLASHIMKRSEATIEKETTRAYTVEEALEVLPKFAEGMDINVKFMAPDDYEASPEIAVVDATGIHLVHGWIIDPDRDALVYKELEGNQSYNVMMTRVVEGKAPAFATWVQGNATQLTHAGIKALQRRVGEGQIVMLFRNNHYTVLTKQGDTLYTLLTDVGFSGRVDAVWQSLEDVDGAASQIVGGHFGDVAKKPAPPPVLQAIPVQASAQLHQPPQQRQEPGPAYQAPTHQYPPPAAGGAPAPTAPPAHPQQHPAAPAVQPQAAHPGPQAAPVHPAPVRPEDNRHHHKKGKKHCIIQ